MEQRKVVAEISVVPIGTGSPSVSEHVAACVEVLDKRGMVYRLTPMGTVVEGSLDEVLSATAEMHRVPFKNGAIRVVTTLKIDDRLDKPISMNGKIESVSKRIPSVKT
jgi:uncharacterized protein (TIGR00106 family)